MNIHVRLKSLTILRTLDIEQSLRMNLPQVAYSTCWIFITIRTQRCVVLPCLILIQMIDVAMALYKSKSSNCYFLSYHVYKVFCISPLFTSHDLSPPWKTFGIIYTHTMGYLYQVWSLNNRRSWDTVCFQGFQTLTSVDLKWPLTFGKGSTVFITINLNINNPNRFSFLSLLMNYRYTISIIRKYI